MKDQKAFACVLQIFVNWNQTSNYIMKWKKKAEHISRIEIQTKNLPNSTMEK
ncbi:hypothetical protein T4E_10471 [Trichinella pseudospiralis]|uniref:Uncharacterized protein n=1 Tax=Trichinella pseudospiralis TaxID=6337 RepID=A0A0V0WXV7_TRIPS|nr:hypothetical protein T4E_10471 [Trichinella pseudospiralis]